MKKIFYIIALGIALAGCSNNKDELLSTGSFPEDHVIRVITEVNEPLSRAGYDAMNLERFGLMIGTAKMLLITIINKWLVLAVHGVRLTVNRCFGMQKEHL